ncbi:CheR family methyltransferase [Pseudomonas sp. X10]
MPAGSRPPLLTEAAFDRIRQRVAQACGIYLADDRRSVVANRLHKRLKHHRLDSFEAYLDLLDNGQCQAEHPQLLNLLIARDTYFFREHRHFELLAQWLRQQPNPVRLWSAACASGEEAWSLAMVAAEQAQHRRWQVLASDLNPGLLKAASEGVYDIAQARYFPAGWLQRHCLCGADGMSGRLQVAAHLRGQVQFRQINLIQPLPDDLGPFDAILLRNLLAGFAPEHKARTLHQLLAQLRPGGLLLIGHSESIHGLDLPLRPILPSVFKRL